MIYRLDLHTHSIISHDGGITDDQYEKLLEDKSNFVAITDHNEISFAQKMYDQIGEQIIVGEEIMTIEGEIIGLFLQNKIEPGLSAHETCDQISKQQGLVYIPHPLETMRKGLQMETLEQILNSIDVIEIFNARIRQPWFLPTLEKFVQEKGLATAASSDAHGVKGLNTSFTELAEKPTRENLVNLLKSGSLRKKQASLVAYLDPLKNKLKKKLHL